MASISAFDGRCGALSAHQSVAGPLAQLATSIACRQSVDAVNNGFLFLDRIDRFLRSLCFDLGATGFVGPSRPVPDCQRTKRQQPERKKDRRHAVFFATYDQTIPTTASATPIAGSIQLDCT